MKQAVTRKAVPEIWPSPPTAKGVLKLPPSVPMSTIPLVRVHENAWVSESDVKLEPAT